MRAPAFWADPPDRFSLASTALAPAAWAYGAAHRLRWQMTKPKRAAIPVVCIGNLVAGGAGKTPTAIAVASALRARGGTPHFITRGYGGSATGPLRVDPAKQFAALVGDEALLLARVAPTWVARDRAAAADRAVADGATVLVLDDGFQNPTLTKDVSLVVMDAFGVGNGRVLPAGPLREDVASGLGRASAVVAIGDARTPAGVPVLAADVAATEEARARLAGRRVVAFAGIGRPEKFFDLLRALGCTLVTKKAFPDHHVFTRADLAPLRGASAASGAPLVTTAKDSVRLDDLTGIEVLDIEVRFRDGDALARVLAPALRTG